MAIDQPGTSNEEYFGGKVRKTSADFGVVMAEFTCTIQANVIGMSLSNAQTVKLAGPHYWDVQIKSQAGSVTTLARGRMLVTEEITREVVVA